MLEQIQKIERLIELKKLREEIKRSETKLRDELLESVQKEIESIELKHGNDGADGKDGRDGIDGKDGKDGIDGKDGRDGRDGKDGKDGADGHGLESVRISDGNLIITLSDGTEKNAGKLPTSRNGGKYARSPYEFAMDYGYTGTESEFADALGNIGQGGGHVIQKNGVSFAQRANLNFTGSVTVTDSADTTTVNVSGGSGGGNTYFPSGW